MLILDRMNEEFYDSVLTTVVMNKTRNDKIFIFLTTLSELHIYTASNEIIIMNDK